MKKRLISAISIVLILIVSSFGFAGCGKKDNDKNDSNVVPATSANEESTKDVNSDNDDVVYETVYVMVTDKNGQPKTNENNEAITETSKVIKTTSKKTKKTKSAKKTKTQKVKGGTDPYVEDPF